MTDMPTPTLSADALRDLQALYEKATPGKLRAFKSTWPGQVGIEDDEGDDHPVEPTGMDFALAQLFAAAVNALPALIADLRSAAGEAEKLRAEVERLKPYEDELRKIAEDVGEGDDPFAAWEVIVRADSASTLPRPAPGPAEASDAVYLHGFLEMLMQWQAETFGPRQTLAGLRNHFDKEWIEIEENPTDLKEWLGLLNLVLSGARLHGHSATDVSLGWQALLTELMGRTWPDWRDADPDKAIEHDRSAPPAAGSTEGE